MDKNKKNKKIKKKPKAKAINKAKIKGKNSKHSRRFTNKKIIIIGGTSILGMIALGSILIFSLFLYYSYGTELPSVKSLKSYKPLTCIKITDRNGKLISTIGKERRTLVPYNKIPKILIKAVLSAEDRSFFHHKGLNYLGMFRALWVNVSAGRFKQGGSTITQQVVKRLLLNPRRTLRRKFQEVILARRVEATLSKEEILHIYLNEIYLGAGRYGVEEASLYYFSKHVWELKLGEAALLAALPQGPEFNSPIRHPKRAKKRQIYVLKQMVKHGFADPQKAQKAIKADLPLNIKKNLNKKINAEVFDLIRKKINNKFRKYDGLTIKTTIDLNFQIAARKALINGLKNVDKRQKVTKLKHLSGKKLKRHLKKLKSRGIPRVGPIYNGVVVGRVDKKIVIDLGLNKGLLIESMERYYPKGYRWNPPVHKKKKRRRKRRKKRKNKLPAIRVGDLVRVKVLYGKTKNKNAPLKLRVELGPQGAVVLLDTKNRDVLALIGGSPMKPGDFNRALKALRQPGSSFKPFVYSMALDSKKFTPGTILNDGPEVHQKWIPRSHGKYLGRITLRKALAKSINPIAVYLLSKVKLKSVISLVERIGITTPVRKDLSIALGTSEVYLIELTNAYGVFPSMGIARPPRFILKIGENTNPPKSAKRVLKPQVAWLMNSLLRSVVKQGTARRARKLKFFVAGKTGTTNKSRDAWFIGYSPHYICGVWVGYDDTKPLGRREEGGKTALPVFVELMKKIHKGKSRRGFLIPNGIVSKLIDPKTGESVHPGTKGAITEYFLKGTEPDDPAPEPTLNINDSNDNEDPDQNDDEDPLTE
jgi:penicillin-binding protein 1A